MTSSVTSPFEIPRPLSYRLPIVTYPLAAFVSEIFDLKVADKHTNEHTNPQNSTLTDNKGPLKLSAREPIFGGFLGIVLTLATNSCPRENNI